MPAATARPFRDAVRFWWIRNGERAGLVIVVLALASLLALCHRVGAPIPLTGVVIAVNFQEGGKSQPAFNAWVDLGGSQTFVGLPHRHGCVVGSRIALEKVRFRFGQHYAIAREGCHAPKATGR